MIKTICAVGPNGEFGKGDGLPWNVPGDLSYFKFFTYDCILVMSRTAFESLPGKLPGRKHIVLSDSECVAKNGAKPDFIIPENVSLKLVCELLDGMNEEDVAVIGGRKLLAEAMEFADKVSVTEINAEIVGEADVYFEGWGLARLNEKGVLDINEVAYGRILEWVL
ncbi:dihydrofolate reductase [Vibrio phage D181]